MQHPNHTVVTNHSSGRFACDRTCPYCTWRSSPYLPRGPHADRDVEEFASRCRKSFVTISGGGEPLWRPGEHGAHVRRLSEIIRSAGKRVRVITREVAALREFRGCFDVASVSLDRESMGAFLAERPAASGSELEFSLVLPPVPTEGVARLMPRYRALRGRLGARLVLRENLNALQGLDLGALATGDPTICFVPKGLCLAGRYLVRSGQDVLGHDLIVDAEALVRRLMEDPGVYIFGGLARHAASPLRHPEFTDVDLVAHGETWRWAVQRAGYALRRVSPEGAYPAYHLGTPAGAGKRMHVVEVGSDEDARAFVFSAQYDVDRLALHRGEFLVDPSLGVGLDGIRERLGRMTATLAPRAPAARRLLSPRREAVERNHASKMFRKGFRLAGANGGEGEVGN